MAFGLHLPLDNFATYAKWRRKGSRYPRAAWFRGEAFREAGNTREEFLDGTDYRDRAKQSMVAVDLWALIRENEKLDDKEVPVLFSGVVRLLIRYFYAAASIILFLACVLNGHADAQEVEVNNNSPTTLLAFSELSDLMGANYIDGFKFVLGADVEPEVSPLLGKEVSLLAMIVPKSVESVRDGLELILEQPDLSLSNIVGDLLSSGPKRFLANGVGIRALIREKSLANEIQRDCSSQTVWSVFGKKCLIVTQGKVATRVFYIYKTSLSSEKSPLKANYLDITRAKIIDKSSKAQLESAASTIEFLFGR